jgi:hypothetical protein
MHITISELENDLDGYLDTAESEPVIIEKSGVDFLVMLPYATRLPTSPTCCKIMLFMETTMSWVQQELGA